VESGRLGVAVRVSGPRLATELTLPHATSSTASGRR